MKTKKKLSILLVCVAAVFCLGCVFTFTACGGSDKNLVYELNSDGNGYIVSAADHDITKAKIPSKHEGLPVTEIYSFMNCPSLKSVTIPDSVTKICVAAFKNCSALQSVSIPDSVTTIGGQVFDGCASMKTAKIGSGVTEIPIWMFCNCWALESITFTSSIKEIADAAFGGCSSLTNIYFKGSFVEWQSIDIKNSGTNNDYFLAAKVNFI